MAELDDTPRRRRRDSASNLLDGQVESTSMPPSSTPSATARLSRWLSQRICEMHGHDLQLQIGERQLHLFCSQCGYTSPGWSVGRTAQGPPTAEAGLPSPPPGRSVSAPAR